jgi:hypothetical protein
MMAAIHPVRAYSCSAVCACKATEFVVFEGMDAGPRGLVRASTDDSHH